MQKNAVLATTLHRYFINHQIETSKADFTSDIKALETALQTLIPQQLALIDIASHQIVLISLVQNIKTLRKLLIQLVLTLAP